MTRATQTLTSHVESRHSYLMQRKSNVQIRLQLQNMAELHNKLCDSLFKVNSAYSVQVLSNLATIFVSITIALFLIFYIFFTNNASNEAHQLLIFVEISVSSSLRIVFLLYSCTSCSNKVSENCNLISIYVSSEYRFKLTGILTGRVAHI